MTVDTGGFPIELEYKKTSKKAESCTSVQISDKNNHLQNHILENNQASNAERDPAEISN